MRFHKLFTVSCVMLVFCAALIHGRMEKCPIVKKSRPLMGTWVNIKLNDPTMDAGAAEALINQAFSGIEKIDALMSVYRYGSETSMINRLDTNEKLKLSPEMLTVLNKSKEINSLTGGAFDITVSPLIELWGFYGDRGSAIPSNPEVQKALERIGQNKLIVDSEYGYASLSEKGVRLDLSGVAKGYAVDEAIHILKRNGVRNALVDAGGDIYCIGSGPNNEPWKIGLRHPRKNKIITTLQLRNMAVATSGDYENFRIADGKRLSHIIDPRTGYPVRNKPISVTVLAPDCATADALATGLTVLGAEKGLELVEDLYYIEAIFISENNGSLEIAMSEGLKGLYEFEK